MKTVFGLVNKVSSFVGDAIAFAVQPSGDGVRFLAGVRVEAMPYRSVIT